MKAITKNIENQQGKLVPIEFIIKENDLWYLENACLNSEALGLGQCQCNSHNVYYRVEITEEEALKIVNKALKNDSLA